MTGLPDFLRGCLQAEEDMALACYDLDWAVGGTPDRPTVYAPDLGESVLLGVVTPGGAAHVAYWCPQRVLACVAAKRRLIDAILEYEAKIDGEWGCCHSAEQIESGECPEIPPDETEALRILAAPYAGRPGWREEWGTT